SACRISGTRGGGGWNRLPCSRASPPLCHFRSHRKDTSCQTGVFACNCNRGSKTDLGPRTPDIGIRILDRAGLTPEVCRQPSAVLHPAGGASTSSSFW